MDKRTAKPWYVGVTHVLTSYVTAGIFAFVVIFFIALASVLFQFNNETARVYVTLLSSLVILPLFLFPATMYSVRFIMNRYVISKKAAVLRHALVSIAVFKVMIDWVSLSPFNISSVVSFLLSLAVFYGVSVKCLENNEFTDSINLKDTNVKE